MEDGGVGTGGGGARRFGWDDVPFGSFAGGAGEGVSGGKESGGLTGVVGSSSWADWFILKSPARIIVGLEVKKNHTRLKNPGSFALKRDPSLDTVRHSFPCPTTGHQTRPTHVDSPLHIVDLHPLAVQPSQDFVAVVVTVTLHEGG